MTHLIAQGLGSALLLTQGFGSGTVVVVPGCVHGSDRCAYDVSATDRPGYVVEGRDRAVYRVDVSDSSC